MSKQTALIIVDVQVDLFKVPGRPIYCEEELLANIAHLLEQAGASGTPVIYIQHQEEAPSSLVPGTRGWRIHPSITPLESETIIPKRSPDAFLATTLDEEFHARQVTHLVITGCRTDFCVDTTCRAAISHGYDVTLVGDAHPPLTASCSTRSRSSPIRTRPLMVLALPSTPSRSNQPVRSPSRKHANMENARRQHVPPLERFVPH